MEETARGVHRHSYPDRDALAVALAAGIAAVLAGSVAEKGQATLAVSGGSTPRKLFDVLSRTAIEWDRVTVILVDERIVPADHERANQRLVRETLLRDRAAKAHFVAYETSLASPGANAEKSEEIFAGLSWPIDAVVLGMGTDGHTASFFPGGDRLADALDAEHNSRVLPMQAEGAGETRLTLTLPALLETKFLALHIEGAEKAAVFDTALSGSNASEIPVRAVLYQDRTPVHVFWAP
ncbi:6-phosphogluconolactonase [Oricola cellulosilytica]|uniref:6-phosphogluconolactonase n=1 Tax=Oricola cellulosilytica TaxID=1429082 RepID=A0A4V2MPB2_9HYPH|nr:6-phosphogluconolactonase [Oricola cellulosilytica]TCD16762.1 6-phosphogluconolactonase [Oricola cellulosilytica]